MQLLGSQTINGALGLKGTAVAGTGNATAVLLVQSTLAGQRQLAVQQVSSAQTGDLFTALDYNGNVMTKVDQNGQIRSYGIGQQVLPLGTPVVTSVVNVGTAGTTTYGYRVAALNSQGQTLASTEVTTTTGIDTLTSANYNTISWNPIAGAVSYRVYGRFVGAEALLVSVNGDGRTSAYSYNDNTTAGANIATGLNPIPNSSLSVNINTWLATACTLARDVTHGAPGALNVGSALMTATGSDMKAETSSSANPSNQRNGGITTNATYTGSVYVYLGTAPSAQVNIRYYDAAGGYLATNFGAPAGSASAWTRLTVTGLAPTNAVYAAIEVECPSVAVGQTCWFTAPQIDPGATASTYVYDLPQATAGTKLVVQQWSGATGTMQEWQSYGGGALAAIGPGGAFTPYVGGMGYNAALNYFGSSVANSPVLRIEGYGNGGSGAGSLITVVNRNVSGNPVQLALGGAVGAVIISGNVNNTAITARGMTGQTGNIQEWQDPTATTVLASVDSTGRASFPTVFAQAVKDPTTLQTALNLNTAGYVLDVVGGTGSASRVTQRLRMTASQLADAFQLQDSTGTQVLARISNAGVAQYAGIGTTGSQLATPVITSVTTAGAAGTTAYAYRVSALNAWGETVASTEVSITTGNSTLSATNYNVVSWGAVTGATSYRVYGRVAGAEGLLATVTGATTWNDQVNSPQAATAGLNPIPNSSLNVNTSMWSKVGCTTAPDPTVAPPVPGVTAGLLTSTVATGGCNTQTSSPVSIPRQFVAVTPSTQYTASAWVYLGTMPSAAVGLQWFDSAFAVIAGTASAGLGSASGWTRISVSFTVPAGAAYCNLYIQGNETAVGQTMWFAAPQIDPGVTPLPYVRDLPLGTGAAVLGGPVTAASLTATTVTGSSGVYDGSARVYSTNNPPPGSPSAVSLATLIKLGTR